MSAVRNVWADLVDKRLWPIALLLLVALIAVPLLLAKPASVRKPATPVAGAGPSPLVANPASVGANANGGPVGGKFKDPFKQLHVAKPPANSSTRSGLGPTTSGSSGNSGSTSGSSGSNGSGSSAADEDVTKLQVKFGPSVGKRKTREITAGTPLPSSAVPLIVYIDVAKNGKAVFLVSSDAQPQGDGQCEPNPTICSTLSLSPGETEFFDVTSVHGTVQYQLDVVKIVKP